MLWFATLLFASVSANLLEAIINSEILEINIIDADLVKPSIQSSDDVLLNQCYSELNRYTKNLFSEPYKSMLMSSSNDLGQIGDMKTCNNLPATDYRHINMNVSYLPAMFSFGACLPRSCSEAISHDDSLFK